MRKQNCWEFKKCGRQPQGPHVADLGLCPATIEEALDDIHGGANAGRSCWMVAGTLCKGQVQGTFAQKFKNCQACDFFQLVRTEEGFEYRHSVVLMDILQKKEKK